jgi:hypothetical protein
MMMMLLLSLPVIRSETERRRMKPRNDDPLSLVAGRCQSICRLRRRDDFVEDE